MRELVKKINVAPILSGHFATLEDQRNPRPNTKLGDVFVFYGLPLIGTLVMMWFRVTLSDTTISVITTALSILAGLLINLLVLMHSLAWDKHEDPQRSKVFKVLHQLHANISYAILISLLAVVPLVVAGNYDVQAFHWHRRTYGYVAAGLTMHFGVTMLMIVKRMYLMLQYRLPDLKPYSEDRG